MIKRKPSKPSTISITNTSMQDISSQEEEQMRLNLINNTLQPPRPQAVASQTTNVIIIKPKNIANTGNLPAPKDLKTLANYTMMPLEDMPVIQSIQQLIHDNPHMQSNPATGQPNCEAACNKFLNDMKSLGHNIELQHHTNNNNNTTKKKSSSTTATTDLVLGSEDNNNNNNAVDIKKSHKNCSDVIPWQFVVFTEKIRKLHVPNWYFNDSTLSNEAIIELNKKDQDTFNNLLRRGVLALPEQNTIIENELLTEAGEWKHIKPPYTLYYFPSCSLGLECIGQSESLLIGKLKGLTSPIKLTQVMYIDEYKTLLKTNSTSHIPPRPCVLCCRYLLADWVTFLRANQMQGKTGIHKMHSAFEYKSDQVHQFYRNPQDCVNGYAKQFMLPAKPKEPIIESIVTLNLCQLECKTHPINGRRYIDQSSLFYVPPPLPQPRVGENLQTFSKGVKMN